MAEFVYIDETGSVGKGASKQPQLILVGIIVHEDAVQPLAKGLQEVAWTFLDWLPSGLEFHGVELWHGSGHWSKLPPGQLLAAYEAAIDLVSTLDLTVAHASINKAKLNLKYQGAADENAYRLALQFMLEKIDQNLPRANRIVVADEAKEEQVGAIKMVAGMQQFHGGEVPGTKLRSVIDTMHFVRSDDSPGVQMADLVAFLMQRGRRGDESHPDVQAGRGRMLQVIGDHTRTYRQAWPA